MKAKASSTHRALALVRQPIARLTRIVDRSRTLGAAKVRPFLAGTLALRKAPPLN